MYDELIKRLRTCAELHGECALCLYQGNGCDTMPETPLVQAADAIEELSKPRWIPVTERLPEQDVSVIGAVYHTDLIIAEDGELIEEAYARCQAEAAKHPRGELCFYGEDGWYGCDGFPMICAPSCWMPLPDPPKEENNG